MEQTAESPLRQMVRQTLADLKPYPLRFAVAWRIAAICAIVAGVAMMYGIPESAISCYLVIFLMKPDGTENTIVPVAAAFLITIVVFLLLLVVLLTISSPLLRILAMAIFSFIFLYIGAATKLGEAGGVVALIFAFMLTLLDMVPAGKFVSEGLRFAWEMAVMPLVVMALFSMLFGPSTLRVLKVAMAERLAATRRALGGDRDKLEELLQEGNEDALKRATFVRLFHLAPKADATQIAVDVHASYKLMLAAGAMPEDTPEGARQTLLADIHAAEDALAKGQPIAAPSPARAGAGHAELGARDALMLMSGARQPRFIPAPQEPFVAPDALTNPAYQQFALKITLAAIGCYIFYDAISWQGIHTAMITCYVAALGTTGETIHKLALRISGCLVGAAMGFAAILFIMPYMDEVWQLMAMMFVATLVAGWVSTANERLAYAGVQIGLAFFLCVLQGFSPTTSLDSGWDRIVGILVGNVAVYLVATLIRPAPLAGTVRQNMVKALAGMARLASVAPEQRDLHVAQAAVVETLVGRIRYQIFLLPFEPRRLQLSAQQKINFSEMIAQVSSLNREIYLSRDDLSALSARLSCLAQIVGMAGSASEAVPGKSPAAGEDDLHAPASMSLRLGRMEELGATGGLSGELTGALAAGGGR